MITVLHLRDTDRICGPGKTILETAVASDASQFRQVVGVYCVSGEPPNAYLAEGKRRGIEAIPIRSTFRYDPRLLSTLVRTIKAYRVEIVHSHENKSDLLALLVARICPVAIVSTVHGWILNTARQRAMVAIGSRLLRRFGRVVAVSHDTRRRVLARGVPDDRVVVIHNAIVSENYDPRAVAPGYLRARFGLPTDAVIVGNVGRLSPEKGQRDFLNAAVTLAKDVPGAHFAVVGDGPDRAVLERQAADAGLGGRVLFTGHITDVRPAYRDFDVLALTSHTEGLPNVVLEALCMERPVVATDVGGTGEIVVDGETGLLVGPHSPEEIASGVKRLLGDGDLARRLVANGKTRVLREFSFTNRVTREEAVYRDLLASGRN